MERCSGESNRSRQSSREGGSSIPRVGLRWSTSFSSMRKLAKLLMVDFTRARWLRLKPSCSKRLCAKVVSFCSERGLTEYAQFLLSDLVKRTQTTLHTASKCTRYSSTVTCVNCAG